LFIVSPLALNSRQFRSRQQSPNVHNTAQREPEQLSADDELKLSHKIALGVLDLSQKLTERSIASNTNKFEVMSPVSIASALQLAALGAKGKTYDELVEM
jgi:hypothetical protein